MNKVRRSERHTIIAADVGGQAALFKKPLKYSESVVFSGGRKRLTGKKKTAGMIGDRERIAILAIPEQELALVIGARELIPDKPEAKDLDQNSITHIWNDFEPYLTPHPKLADSR